MIFLYNLFISAYNLALRLASLWNNKARLWVNGRKNWAQTLEKRLASTENIIWMHCASAGELEQGKPVLEALKKKYPHFKVLVSFFSPSGFETAKKYSLADYKTYLPLDTKENADTFLSIVQPKLVVFVKYDYWYHHLKAVNERKIPLILISAIFRENSIFFKSYGGFYRKMLHLFSTFFVQDYQSQKLLDSLNINNCFVGGDTRFDRVSAIASNFTPLPLIEKFIAGSNVFIAGSTWPEDEKLFGVLSPSENLKLIIAPHEINKAHIEKIKAIFPGSITYSALENKTDVSGYPVLVIDNFGMLSRLYYYATLTYIGGGFNKSGIHNTLEAAVWGKAILFGPHFQKFREAKDLIAQKAAFSISTKEELKQKVDELLNNETYLQQTGLAAKDYVQANKGATQKIMNYIQENRLLTKL